MTRANSNVHWLAAFVLDTTVERIVVKRVGITDKFTRQMRQGVYVPRMAWQEWLKLVDEASRYFQMHPELLVRRDPEMDGKPHAFPASVRKDAAIRLASQFNHANGINVAQRADVAHPELDHE